MRLSAYRLHTHFEVLSGKAVRVVATSVSPKGDADDRAALQRMIEADHCYILDRGSIDYRLWNVISVAGRRYVNRGVRQDSGQCDVNQRTDGSRSCRHRDQRRDRRPDPELVSLPTARISEAGHLCYRPTARWLPEHARADGDGVLRLVANRLDLQAEVIAEMYRLRWVIEIFFCTFKQLLGCGRLFSDKHNRVEIQAYYAMIVCILILTTPERRRIGLCVIWSGVTSSASPASKNSRPSSNQGRNPRWRSHGLAGQRRSLLRS